MSVQTPQRLPLTVLRVALAGAATTGLFALVGCSNSGSGSDGSQASSNQTSSSTESSSSTQTSSAPSTEPSTAESSDTGTSGGSGGSGGSGDSGNKPSKQDVRKGLTKFYETSQNMSPDKAKAFATCMTKQLYGHVSNDLLIMMRDGKPDPTKATSSDKTKLAKAGLKCQSVL